MEWIIVAAVVVVVLVLTLNRKPSIEETPQSSGDVDSVHERFLKDNFGVTSRRGRWTFRGIDSDDFSSMLNNPERCASMISQVNDARVADKVCIVQESPLRLIFNSEPPCSVSTSLPSSETSNLMSMIAAGGHTTVREYSGSLLVSLKKSKGLIVAGYKISPVSVNELIIRPNGLTYSPLVKRNESAGFSTFRNQVPPDIPDGLDEFIEALVVMYKDKDDWILGPTRKIGEQIHEKFGRKGMIAAVDTIRFILGVTAASWLERAFEYVDGW